MELSLVYKISKLKEYQKSVCRVKIDLIGIPLKIIASGNISRKIPKKLIRAIFQEPANTSKLEFEKIMNPRARKNCFKDQNDVSYALVRSNMS